MAKEKIAPSTQQLGGGKTNDPPPQQEAKQPPPSSANQPVDLCWLFRYPGEKKDS